MKSITYIIPGDPVPWARAGHVDGRFYDKQKKAKLLTGMHIKNQHSDTRLFDGPLLLEITFHFAMPRTKPKLHDLIRLKPMYYKPDLSNCIKYIEDVCTSLLYYDDCLITDIIAKKRYGDTAYTEFTILELKDNND